MTLYRECTLLVNKAGVCVNVPDQRVAYLLSQAFRRATAAERDSFATANARNADPDRAARVAEAKRLLQAEGLYVGDESPAEKTEAPSEDSTGDGGSIDLAAMGEDRLADLAADYGVIVRDNSGNMISKSRLKAYANGTFRIDLPGDMRRRDMLATFIAERFDQLRAEAESDEGEG